MSRGGKRVGAGNKKGVIRPNFTDYVTGKDIDDFMKWVLKNYKKNDRLAQWFGDHMFGKAMQPITGKDGGPVEIKTITGMKIIKNGD